jgi:hypothetical protein
MTTPEERPDIPPVPPPPVDTPPTWVGPQPLSSPPPSAGQTLEARAQAFGERAEGLGREAEAAAMRFGANPAVRQTADAAGRVWGLVLIAFGLWFFADVTLRLNMPTVAWRDLWPLALIVVGAIVVTRGMTRRR